MPNGNVKTLPKLPRLDTYRDTSKYRRYFPDFGAAIFVSCCIIRSVIGAETYNSWLSNFGPTILGYIIIMASWSMATLRTMADDLFPDDFQWLRLTWRLANRS